VLFWSLVLSVVVVFLLAFYCIFIRFSKGRKNDTKSDREDVFKELSRKIRKTLDEIEKNRSYLSIFDNTSTFPTNDFIVRTIMKLYCQDLNDLEDKDWEDENLKLPDNESIRYWQDYVIFKFHAQGSISKQEELEDEKDGVETVDRDVVEDDVDEGVEDGVGDVSVDVVEDGANEGVDKGVEDDVGDLKEIIISVEKRKKSNLEKFLKSIADDRRRDGLIREQERPKLQTEIKYWLRAAMSDLMSSVCLKNGGFWPQSVHLCQQAVEKALKCLLAYDNVERYKWRKEHRLDRLANLISKERCDRDALLLLSTYFESFGLEE